MPSVTRGAAKDSSDGSPHSAYADFQDDPNGAGMGAADFDDPNGAGMGAGAAGDSGQPAEIGTLGSVCLPTMGTGDRAPPLPGPCIALPRAAPHCATWGRQERGNPRFY